MSLERQTDWPWVSVIVPTFRDDLRLRRCLNGLMSQDYPGIYSVTVVDNNETFSLDTFSADYPLVEFIWEPKPGSYSARNTGIKVTAAPVIAFTDSDCNPRPDWLRNGVLALQQSHQTGFVGGRIAVEAVSKERITMGEYFEMAFAFDQRSYISVHKFAATANMFTRRSIFETVGMFDGDLKAGGDSDWGKRVTNAGYIATYEEAAVVGHPARKTEEVTQKIKRIVGGVRDKNPAWSSCAKYVLSYSRPPVRRMAAVYRFNHPQLSWHTKGQLMLYCLSVNWLYASQRLLIQIFRTPSSR